TAAALPRHKRSCRSSPPRLRRPRAARRRMKSARRSQPSTRMSCRRRLRWKRSIACGGYWMLAKRKAPMGEERPRLARHARGEEHPQVADRQHDVIGGAGHARLAHRDGAVVLLGVTLPPLFPADAL